MDKSGNPALKKSALQRLGEIETATTATVGGTMLKTVVLLFLVVLGGVLGWRMMANEASYAIPALWGSMILAGVLAFVTIFVPKAAPFTSPIYALAEGVLLGSISQLANTVYTGIAMQAIVLTGAVFVTVLYLYATGMVKVTAKLRAVIIIATLSIALYYFIALIVSLFGGTMPLIYDSGTFGIVFSLIVVLIAALNLLLDFDFISKTAKAGAPKLFEWYGAFSLMVTLIWLYIEILRLLAKMRN